MKIIDTKGQLCPTPLILVKKGIMEAADGETIEILTNNDTAFLNLQTYLKELKLTPQIRKEGDVNILTVVKPEILSDFSSADSPCAPKASNYVVVIKSEFMGSGVDELGQFLMQAFVNSLNEADKQPTAILLYNSGVKVAVKGTETAISLEKLENKGIPIYACGKCLEYYKIENLMAVGMVSNMYTITKYMTEAGHVIYP